MSVDRERAMAAVTEFLAAMGLDTEASELRRTPERVTELAAEMFGEVGADPAEALGNPIRVSESETVGQLVSAEEIGFRSVCPHHLLPFEGRVDISYAPRARLAGFSRLVRLVSAASRRLQLQERMGELIADTIMQVLEPHGVSVRIEAAHGCVEALEPQGGGTRLVTVCTRGELPG